MKNVERIVEMLKGKELNALFQVTNKDSRKAKPWAPISRHTRVSFKLVIKMFVKMPFDVGLRGWWERAKHLKGWGLLPSSLPYLQGWVRTWINAGESLSDPQLKPRRELEEKLRTRIISVCMSLKVFFFFNINQRKRGSRTNYSWYRLMKGSMPVKQEKQTFLLYDEYASEFLCKMTLTICGENVLHFTNDGEIFLTCHFREAG